MAGRECTQCGACCVAPDIFALDKPLGRPCEHLGDDLLCQIYETRPLVCRSYAADAFCDQIAAATLAERVENYLAAFGLSEASTAIPASATMRNRRRLSENLRSHPAQDREGKEKDEAQQHPELFHLSPPAATMGGASHEGYEH